MSTLTLVERAKLEDLFQMSTGCVLDFTNRTLADFVEHSTGRDIYDRKYDYGTGSKANRLRAFWTLEPDYVVGHLLNDLLEHCRDTQGSAAGANPRFTRLFETCERITRCLLESSPVERWDAITPEGSDRAFEVLAKDVRRSIEKNEPEVDLDRLHTYVTSSSACLQKPVGRQPPRTNRFTASSASK